jgi:hypothetical protein
MSVEQLGYERRLQALGRILDRQASPKEICVLQSGDGFVVHLLAATNAYEGASYAPTTLVIEPEEVTAVLAAMAEADAQAAPKKVVTGWFGRG